MDKGISINKYTSIYGLREILTKDKGLLFRTIDDFNDLYEIVDIQNPQEYKVVCFTKCSSSVLMWAHYGKSHQGCLITLNKKQFEKMGLDIKKVEHLNRNDRKQKKDIEKIFVKGKRWKYEGEYRLLLDDSIDKCCINKDKEGKTYLKPFIKKVCFGCNVKDSIEYKETLEIIKSQNDLAIKERRKKKDYIEVKKYKISDKGFSLEYDKDYNYETELDRLSKIDGLKSCNATYT